MAEQKSAADKAEQQAKEAEINALETERKVALDARTPEQKKVDDANQKAADARAEAEQAKREELRTDEPTLVGHPAAKGLVALVDPEMKIGDHLAQKFSHTPANPQIAPGVNGEPTVKLTLETSDTKAAGQPLAAFVHPEMVGDYLRAGWTRSEA